MPKKSSLSPLDRWPQTAGPNLALLAGITALFFWKVFLHPDQMLWANDIVRAHMAFRQIQWQSFWNWGSFPLWDPTSYCGRSIVADPIHALFYAPGFVFWLISAPSVFGFFLWFQVTLGAWGMFFCARRLGADAVGALFAAVAFAVGGKAAAHVFAGHVELLSTMLGLPWIMWAAQRALENRRLCDAGVLGLVLVLTATCGSVQVMYFHLLFVSLYVLLWGLARWVEHGWRDVTRPFLVYGGAIVAFLLLGAFWWFPIVRQTLLLGARARGTDFAFAASGSPGYEDLLRFVWPYWGVPQPQVFVPDAFNEFFWETASYPGMIVLCLALPAMVCMRGKSKALILTALSVASVMLALGENSPFFWLACKLVPGFAMFRCPGRMFFYTSFGFAALGGLLITQGKNVQTKWFVPAFCCVAFEAVLIGALLLKRVEESPTHGLWTPALFSLVLAPIAFLWISGSLRDSTWRFAVFGLLALELFIFWTPHVQTVPPKQAVMELSIPAYLAEQGEGDPFRFLDATGMVEQHHAAINGLEMITGYHPAVSGRHLDLYRRIWVHDESDFVQQFMHSPREIACPVILDLMNTKYLVAYEPDLGGGYRLVFRTPEHETRHPRYVYERESALPRAFVVGRAVVPPEGTSVLDALCSLQPRECCLVDDEPIEGNAEYQPLSVERHSFGDITLRFATAGPGIVVLSQSWHPDWVATDNGEQAEVRRVNHNFVGIPVAAGQHEVRIWYRPWDFYLSAAISAVAAAGLLGCAFALFRLSSPTRLRQP